VNRLALLRALLWLLTAVFFAGAVERARFVSSTNVQRGGSQTAAPAFPQLPIAAESLNALADHIVGADAFRITRRPSPVPFGATADARAANVPKPSKPALVLSGIVGGPPWIGVVDGVPGHDQTVLVHSGDTLGGLRIRSITKDHVLVAGLDTVWRLTVHQPWQ